MRPPINNKTFTLTHFFPFHASRFLLLIFLWCFSSCGYHLQNTQNPLYYQKGVERVYIQNIVNASPTLGIENTVLRSFLQEIESQKKIKIVTSPDNADAFLTITIQDASFSGTNAPSIKSLVSRGVDLSRIPDNIFVASEYSATLSCSFELTQPDTGKTIWNTSLSRQKFFPANNQLGTLGTTSSFINESEFKRSISDLSSSMMNELSEHMLGIF